MGRPEQTMSDPVVGRWKGPSGRPMLREMCAHRLQATRTTPTASEDREVIAAHYRAEARQQETEDARARWLGYRSEADFTDRAAAMLARHPRLPAHIARHARFVYLGVDR